MIGGVENAADRMPVNHRPRSSALGLDERGLSLGSTGPMGDRIPQPMTIHAWRHPLQSSTDRFHIQSRWVRQTRVRNSLCEWGTANQSHEPEPTDPFVHQPSADSHRDEPSRLAPGALKRNQRRFDQAPVGICSSLRVADLRCSRHNPDHPGAMAQLGARLHGMQKVASSSLAGSSERDC